MRREQFPQVSELRPIQRDLVPYHIDEDHGDGSLERRGVRVAQVCSGGVVGDEGCFDDETSHADEESTAHQPWAWEEVNEEYAQHAAAPGEG